MRHKQLVELAERASEFLNKTSAEELAEPKFRAAFDELSNAFVLTKRVLALLEKCRSNRTIISEHWKKRDADAGTAKEAKEIFDSTHRELLGLEIELRKHKFFGEGHPVLGSLVNARGDWEENVAGLLREKRRSGLGGFAQQENTFEAETRFEKIEEDDAGLSWRSRLDRKEEKKKRREARDEILRELKEKIRGAADARRTGFAGFEAATFAKAEVEDESDPVALFERTRQRAKRFPRRSYAWAMAVIDVKDGFQLDEAKARYYELAKMWHPDVNSSHHDTFKEAMILLNDAWKIIKSEFKKRSE